MSVFANLSADDQALIDKKLEELSQKTGDVWTCEIARQTQAAGGDCYLEIKVNGRSLLPICLDAAADLRVHGFVLSWTSCTSQEWWIRPVRELRATCKDSESHPAVEQRGIYIRLIEPGEVARVRKSLSLWYREILKHMNE